MKYQILSLGNQWVISHFGKTDREIVGKILPKPNNSVIFSFNNNKIKLTSRIAGNLIFYSINEQLPILKSNLKLKTQKHILNWKNTNEPNDLYNCIKQNGLYYLKNNNKTIAKLKEISERCYLLELNQQSKLSQIIIFACFYPFISLEKEI